MVKVLHGACATMEQRVWLAQCLCPQRHCMLASAGLATTGAEALELVATPLRKAVNELIAGKVLNPWCGICQAAIATWTFELGRMEFTTMEDAEAALRQSEADQLRTAEWYGDHKGTRH